jgi:hypothetical protein
VPDLVPDEHDVRDVGLPLREAEDEDARRVEEVEEGLRVLGMVQSASDRQVARGDCWVPEVQNPALEQRVEVALDA